MRAVKLSSTVVLPPSTAGSACICGPTEAKSRVTNLSIAAKHTLLPQRKKFLYSVFIAAIFLDTFLTDFPSPFKILCFPSLYCSLFGCFPPTFHLQCNFLLCLVHMLSITLLAAAMSPFLTNKQHCSQLAVISSRLLSGGK